jgi:hypothetical protein
MRTDMNVDEPRLELGCVFELVAHESHGSREKHVIGSGQIDQVRGVDGNGADIQLDEPLSKHGCFRGRLGSTMPGRGVVAEDLQRGCADFCRALHDPNKAEAQGQVRAGPPAAG